MPLEILAPFMEFNMLLDLIIGHMVKNYYIHFYLLNSGLISLLNRAKCVDNCGIDRCHDVFGLVIQLVSKQSRRSHHDHD